MYLSAAVRQKFYLYRHSNAAYACPSQSVDRADFSMHNAVVALIFDCAEILRQIVFCHNVANILSADYLCRDLSAHVGYLTFQLSYARLSCVSVYYCIDSAVVKLNVAIFQTVLYLLLRHKISFCYLILFFDSISLHFYYFHSI